MASNSVDLPVPFSPTKKQMRLVISRELSDAMGGILKGYSSQLITRSRSSLTFLSRSISSGFQHVLSHYISSIKSKHQSATGGFLLRSEEHTSELQSRL